MTLYGDTAIEHTLDLIEENVPLDLRCRPQWVNWRFEERGEKLTKVPFTPGTECRASTTDLLTWATFEEAASGAESGDYDGVGFVFCSADPFVGLDFDDCRDPETGELDPQVLEIIEQYNKAYVEVSISGRGIHLITFGKICGGAKKGDYEIYDQDRYFCVTGVGL